MIRAEQKAHIRWGSDRHQRGRERLRQDCLRQLTALHDPKEKAALERVIGADEVSRIIRANKQMLESLK